MSENVAIQKKPIKKTGLGRGLGSLLGESPLKDSQETKNQDSKSQGKKSFEDLPKDSPASEKDRVIKLGIEQVYPNKTQPRKIFNEEKLKELASSIREKGVIQPILVRKRENDEGYEIIAGERRWRASQLAGLHSVPAIVKESSPQEQMELALIENIQRADLNYVEEAEAYNLLINKFKLTQLEVAQKVGKERATVANLLRILHLPSEVRQLMKEDVLTLGQAKLLLSLEDQEAQKKLAKKAVNEALTVRALEKLINKYKCSQEDLSEASNTEEKVDAGRLQAEVLSQQLQKALGTRVKIDYSNGKGTVHIQYYSDDQLNQVVERLMD